MTPRAGKNGDILLQTIFFVTVIFSLVFTLAGLMTSQLRWADHSDNQLRAQLAARSALNRAIAELKKDQEFTGDIVWTQPDLEESASITFDRSKPYFSTNNTRNSLAVEAYKTEWELSDGRCIPNAVHLVALGTCRNARYVAEAEIIFPAYPYAMASSGPIQSQGQLEVFGVESLSQVDSTHPDDRLESHIISNSREGSSIVLTSGAEVSGDLRSTGGIQANGAQVEGDILANESDEADLPRLGLNRPPTSTPQEDKTIYLSDYDFTKNLELASDSDRNVTLNPADAQADPDAFDITELRVRIDQGGPSVAPLELNRGVQLNDATLFVDGNLVIRNGLQGRGAILATGSIEIHGPSHLASDQIALLSGGGVNINGQGSSRFRGLVATMADFKADNVQVAGTFLSVSPEDTTTQIGPAGNEPGMTLENVTTVHAPDANKMDIVIHVELQDVLQGGLGLDGSSGSQIGLLHTGTFYTFTGDPNASQAEREAQIQATYQALLGIQGETHPMVDGRVVLRAADGSYEEDPNSVPQSISRTMKKMIANWDNYTTKLETSEVKEVEIFRIDLNRFTSGSSRAKILYYR